jgi:hypothetical protein
MDLGVKVWNMLTTMRATLGLLVVQDVNQFHIGGIWQVGSTNGAYCCKSCTIYRWALQSKD